jgi:fructose-bisphosphate aldolase class 1
VTGVGSVDATLETLLAPGKGMIAPDEHPDRLARSLGVDIADPLVRGRHRAMVLSTPHLKTWISAVVVDRDALVLDRDPAGLLVGIRLGSDTDEFRHGDSVTRRAADLRAQLSGLREGGASFVKWRADLDPMTAPASAYVDTAYLAACAAVSLDCGLLPVLDVAMPNQRTHSSSVAIAVTANALTSLFAALRERDVDVSRVLVRMNMVRAGAWHDHQPSPRQVGIATLRVLSKNLPEEAPGVMFMSTGLDGSEACADLAAISAEAESSGWVRPFTFGFSRALLNRATTAWVRDGEEVAHRLIAQECAAASAATTARPVRV